MKYQLVLLVFYSVLFVLHFGCVAIIKINFYISAFDWLKINNKYDFRLANRFEQ